MGGHNNGDLPAFPVPGDQQYPEMNGMTYRQWVAGQVLAGMANILSNNTAKAQDAVEQADALIAELEKPRD